MLIIHWIQKKSKIICNFSVVLAAEHDIKRLTVAVDWNLMEHVQSLFEFFLGTLKTIRQQEQVKLRFSFINKQ